MSGLLVTIRADGTVIQERWEGTGRKTRPDYKKMQAIVGGTFQLVECRYDTRIRQGYVDEDGIQKRLQINPFAMEILTPRWKPSRIWGDMVIWVPDSTSKKKEKSDGDGRLARP